MKANEHGDWRRDSEALEGGERNVSAEAQSRVWGATGFRVFLSHRADVKVEVGRLKEGLARLGVSAFVAHKDIHPTKEWQDEIENALATMEAFVALMTDDFHESDWTDQEVGYAFGRGVPLIAVKLGRDPYGFIGKFQALKCDWSNTPHEIVKLFMKHAGMVDNYVGAVERCISFEAANEAALLLPAIVALTPSQVNRLVAAFNDNADVRGSFGFNGTSTYRYGDGLAVHLTRITGRAFVISRRRGTSEFSIGVKQDS